MDYVVPDATGEPVKVWRTWYVVPEYMTSGDLRLRSWVYGRIWEIGEPFEATCNREMHIETDTPDERCTCGLYGLDEREGLNRYYRDRYANPGSWTEIARVTGEVDMWGKVFKGEHGYRAQYAYPTRIEVPKRVKGREQFLSPKEICLALERYGCEVTVNDDVLDLTNPWAGKCAAQY